jgi:hypothetical protein
MKEIAGIIGMVLTRVTTIVLADGERAIADRPVLADGTISNSSEGGEKEPPAHAERRLATVGEERVGPDDPLASGETGAGDAAGMGNRSGASNSGTRSGNVWSRQGELPPASEYEGGISDGARPPDALVNRHHAAPSLIIRATTPDAAHRRQQRAGDE